MHILSIFYHLFLNFFTFFLLLDKYEDFKDIITSNKDFLKGGKDFKLFYLLVDLDHKSGFNDISRVCL